MTASSSRRLYYGLLALVSPLERFLGQAAWGLTDALLAVPVMALALVSGLLAWRGRRPVAGIAAALGVQVAASTGAWPTVVHTLSMVVVIAVVSAPGMLAVAYGVSRLLSKLPDVALDARVIGPLAAMFLPAALFGLIVPTAGAWLLSTSLVSGVVAGAILGAGPRPSWPSTAFTASFTAFGVVVLAGLLGAPGLGGELLRTVPTREVTAASRLVLALGGVCVAFLAVRPSPGHLRGGGAPDEGSRTVRSAIPSSGGDAEPDATTSRLDEARP